MSSLKQSYGRLTNNEISILLRNMTDDGDPAGNADADVDGSITPVEFFIQPLPTTAFEVVQVTVEISDAGNPGLNDFGNIVGPLANGVQFFIDQKGSRLLFGNPIKTNRSLIGLGPIVQRLPFQGGVEVGTFTFNVFEHAKQGILLSGNTNDKFGIIIQDNLLALEAHTVVVKGNIRLETV